MRESFGRACLLSAEACIERSRIMPFRDIYLRIETIPDYSPVEPDDHVSPPIQYRRDCMPNMGHQDGMIPDHEGAAARLPACVHPEYLGPGDLRPQPHMLVAADV